ncbi:MAG TPA: bifunctional YncE family protein/alkaline phosphatase family protein [Thermoanaerobaculia bacterium]|nr:bifunctional YncE family protein/alkaline phosphatase family protein [Thermoanaerobaculia bacterium]
MRQPTLLIAAFLILAVARPVPSPAAAATLAGAAVAPTRAAVAIRPQAGARLPTGALLDPAGRSSDLGNMPIAMALAPEGDRVVVLLAGWREQGFQVVETSSGRVLQTVELPAAFLGLAFSADGHTLYVAGGYEDVIYRFDWQAGVATPAGAIALADRPEAKKGSRYPAGLALSRDGRTLYVAENLADSLAVVDLASGKVLQRLPAGHYPYAAVVGGGGEVYVSAWGGDTVSVFAPAAGAGMSSAGAAGPSLAAAGSIQVGRHPTALLLSASGARLFVASASTDRVAVVDTRARRVVAQLADAAPAGPAEGSTPSALALTAGGRRLLVAESDNNAVAVFELAAATSGVAAAPPRRGRAGRDRLAGRIPVGWYPTAVLAAGPSLLVVNGKGRGTGPNPAGPHFGEAKRDPRSYTLGQTSGTLTVLPAMPGPAALAALDRRVARANGWDAAKAARRAGGHARALYPPLRHVVFIIKENRTYDQVFGDMPGGDGDPRLQFFTRAEAPNHRAIAERFGLFDHFLCNGEVSTQGHSWSTAAYSTDYIEKTTPSAYSSRRAEDSDEETVPFQAGGFLWDLASARGLGARVYGELAKAVEEPGGATVYRSTVPSAAPITSPTYPAWDLAIPDQRRADAWLAELAGFVKQGRMPALEVLHLPNDHTSGAKPGMPTPRASMADNDLALGRIVEGLSRSPFWKDTVVFVVEDDAQNGPDHVDSHRAPLLVISPYSRPGAVHRFANTTDVLATIEEILGLDTLSQFDTFGRPLRGIFAAAPDLAPYQALVPAQPLTDVNPPDAPAAQKSLRLDFSAPDAAPAAELNEILWRTLKGGEPYPAPARISTLDVQRGF